MAGKSGKGFRSPDMKEKYFEKIFEKVAEVSPSKAIFAGPGFAKEELAVYLKEKRLKTKMFFEQINSVGITGINELIKSGIIDRLIAEIQIVKQTRLVEKVLEEIGKERGLCEIAPKRIAEAVEAGAASHLLVTDEVLLSEREKTEMLLEKVEEFSGEIHILSVKNDAGKKLKGLGGMACILRFVAR